MSTTALIHCRGAAGHPALADDLKAAGFHVLGAVERSALVQAAVGQAPDVVVVMDAIPDAALFDALQALQTHAPRPLVLFSESADGDALARAVDVGVQVYVVQGYAASRLRPLVQLAQLRFARDRELRQALDDVTHRFEERKLVDRAKGLLMRARQMHEDEAFAVLRENAMRGGQRIGEMARQIIDAARGAADVNRFGQLRMLSQRLVKLQAQRALRTRPAESAAQMAEAAARAETIVASLVSELPAASFGDLSAGLQRGWIELQAAVQGDATPAAVAQADAAAEQLLQQADVLTDAIESARGVPALRVVNVCGRQRMLSQRVAKHLLLAALPPVGQAKAQRTAAAAAQAEYDKGVAHLEALPLADRDIRAALAAAASQWQALLEGGASAGTPSGRETIAAASEALLELFDGLTGHYERSLQLLNL